MVKGFQRYGILVLLLLVAFAAAAKKRKKHNVMRLPPKALLVMLYTESNRMEALIKTGRYADTGVLSNDMLTVRDYTVKDFARNFNFCTVYFFNEVDLDAVMARHFEGVLMDSTLQPAKNISVADTNYLIVYYGFPGWQSRKGSMEVTNMADMGGKPNGWGLVINNHEMKQVAYSYRLRGLDLKKKSSQNEYKYISKKFDIEYFPLAGDLNNSMKNYAAKYRRRQQEMEAAAQEEKK